MVSIYADIYCGVLIEVLPILLADYGAFE